MAASRSTVTVRVTAPAKINLTLRVLGRRGDGYHELQTTFQSIALHDTLTFRARPGAFTIECNQRACPVGADNLVWQAAERLWRSAGRRGPLAGVGIRIEKGIPMQAGLGGGSSDAAAALRALRILWQLPVRRAQLAAIAAGLGADVPYFLRGGTALGLGRGDAIELMKDATPAWVALVLPRFGVSTVEAYRWWDADTAARTEAASRVPARLGRSTGATATVTNDLEAPVSRRHPAIGQFVRDLRQLGARQAAMSGSGSAVFGLFRTQAAAEAALEKLSGRSRRIVTRTVNRLAYQNLVRPVRRIADH